ncbi:MAG: hypothetical protein PQJ58_00360 [Spirochaetales bacterium]|nr:hypothetical protein [Spirochaetales bacterium]
MDILPVLGISHICFGLLLIGTKKKERADYLLLLWLVVLAMPFLQEVIDQLKGEGIRQIRLNNPSFSLLNGPLLYLYLRELTRDDQVSPAYWPHFLVFILYYLYFLNSSIMLTPGGPSQHLDRQVPPFFLRYFGEISVVSYALYILFSFVRLQKHRVKVKDSYAYHKGSITLIWVNLIPLIFAVLVSILVLGEKTLKWNSQQLHHTVYLTLALYLIFFGLRQTSVFPLKEKVKRTQAASPTHPDGEQSLEKIRNVMEERKLYLNPTLSVYDLANETDIARHKISSLLKERLSQNFYQFVNDYRMNEV